MAKKFTVTKSAFVKQKEHQKVSDGSILIRDWVTIGETHKLEKGKKLSIYGDGNFIFTTNTIQNGQKKQKLSKNAVTWTYEDVKNASEDANIVKLNQKSDNLSDFAYYGSCVELIRGSVENIIREFPANITASNNKIGGDKDDKYYLVNNPFMFDLVNDNVEYSETDNPLRYLAMSWKDYTINGNEITSYSVEWKIKRKEDETLREYNCENNGEIVVKVSISGTELYGYLFDGKLVFGVSSNELDIRPKQEIIDKYFESLEGFEKILLNRDSNPLYTNTFLTPVETNLGYRLVPKKYTWVSNDYCIDIASPLYISFINDLVKIATIFDNEYSDNICRNMTHEAIKNYDWSYTRNYDENVEEDNIEGGNRVEKLLRVYGRLFDDIKRYIDGILFTDNISYDSYNNKPDAELTDELEVNGWDVVSTIPTFEDEYGKSIDMSSVTLKGYGTEQFKWYPTKNKDNLKCVDVDNSFMRKLNINGYSILSSKGTTNAVDMVMALFGFGSDSNDNNDNNHYKLHERYYKTKPLEYNDETVERITNITNDKTDRKLYDDIYSGVPLKDLTINGKHIIVPYFTDRRMYDGDFAFQTKGGWGKYIEDDEENEKSKKNYGYTETLSYLRVVEDVNEMLMLEPHSLKNGDIVYLISTESYIETLDKSDVKVSNYFILRNENMTDKLSSWENLTDENSDDYKYAKYLDNIVNVLYGNNPHVGYGLYDLGDEYIQYMKQPYKYSVDNNNFDTFDFIKDEENIRFDISKNEPDTDVDITIVNNNDKVVIKNKEYDPIKDEYIINSKYFIFENRIDNDLYKEYFREHILPYIMQVIPSTTILVLKGF